MNLLKCRSVVGWIATNLSNRRSVLDLNTNQRTSVMKNRNTSECSGLEYPLVRIRDEKQEYVVDRSVLGFNIHQCTSVTKNRNTL
jgi:hypothetical protein